MLTLLLSRAGKFLLHRVEPATHPELGSRLQDVKRSIPLEFLIVVFQIPIRDNVEVLHVGRRYATSPWELFLVSWAIFWRCPMVKIQRKIRDDVVVYSRLGVCRRIWVSERELVRWLISNCSSEPR